MMFRTMLSISSSLSLLLLLVDNKNAHSFQLQLPVSTTRTTTTTSSAPLISSSSTLLKQSSSTEETTASTITSTKQEEESAAAAAATPTTITAKGAVKVFGRLAEKYIMLDASGGLCCYSACTDCEYRLPGGGYKMADQSASRPKWIPCYETASNGNTNKEHTSKWSSELYKGVLFLTLDDFLERLQSLSYAPTLGGPFLSASAAASMDDEAMDAAKRLFELLLKGATSTSGKLTRHRMSTRLKQLADGEEGLAWNAFAKALGVE